MDNKYIKKLKKCSEQMICNDGRIISSLVLNAPYKEIVSMLLLPYVALYCRESQEYYKLRVLDEKTDKQIIDLRNSIKLICGKYNKIENTVIESDLQQDYVFKNKLIFDSAKLLNSYYNLGVYFDENGHIIGNTQLINIYLNVADVDSEEKNTKLIKLGENIGKSMNRINMMTGKKHKISVSQFEKISIGYIDYNTNVGENLFKNKECKGINLIILHMLGMLGTNKYLLQRICSDNNIWVLRNEYIVAHNIWSGLRVIKGHFQEDKSIDIDIKTIEELVEDGRNFFPSLFRNTMMHYDLIYKDKPCIREDNYYLYEDEFFSKKYYYPDKLLYGLVETCFEGKNATDYFGELRKYMIRIEEYLKSWFSVDIQQINWDL